MPGPLQALREWWCARKDDHNWMVWHEPGFVSDQVICLNCKKRSHR